MTISPEGKAAIRTGQQLRKDDWQVGQYLRKMEPEVYARVLDTARHTAFRQFTTEIGLDSFGPVSITRTD